MLAFEDEDGQLNLVRAEDVAQVLQDSGVRFAMLTACQSAVSSQNDAFSSVAARLIRSGINAVAAMSASVLVVSAARYAEAFYRALTIGAQTPVAQERARQALYDDPRRNIHHRTPDDRGTAVSLRDWWLPHYYQQRPVLLQPTKGARKRTKATANTFPRLRQDVPDPPRYGFHGRARELLQIERALLRKKLVVISGFGGMGKTALAREAADWLQRTDMFDGVCFVSFEQGGNTARLLSALGHYLDVYDANYNPNDSKATMARLKPLLVKTRILVIADNLESILAAGEAQLEPEERMQLWDTLLTLVGMGAGVLLTSRNAAFGDGRLAPGKKATHLLLQGLQPYDAYSLASGVLSDLGLDRSSIPYADLRDLLAQLDHHPLAIQLVLPTLRTRSLTAIRSEFAQLLPAFVDNNEEGRNRSLEASLEYSLSQLSLDQRALVSRLSIFEGGANETDLLRISEITEVDWATLRPALEQAALITVERVHENVNILFIHFHPVLAQERREHKDTQNAEEQAALQQRYVNRYCFLANFLYEQDFQHPQENLAMFLRELPNLRRSLDMLLQTAESEMASTLISHIDPFLTGIGMIRERDRWRSRVEQALTAHSPSSTARLSDDVYLSEIGLARAEREKGDLTAAFTRIERLLRRIEEQPETADVAPGSPEHARVLIELGLCYRDAGDSDVAEQKLYEALPMFDAAIQQKKEEYNMGAIRIGRANLLQELGTVLTNQGRYFEALERYKQALNEQDALHDNINRAVTLSGMSVPLLKLHDYDQARSLCQQALTLFESERNTRNQASTWQKLGSVAQAQKDWVEAERCYRKSLVLFEQMGSDKGAAASCNQLADVARVAGRPDEAEGWYRGAIQRIERASPGSLDHARYLENLASLLKAEVKAERLPESRLSEANGYTEQAKRMKARARRG